MNFYFKSSYEYISHHLIHYSSYYQKNIIDFSILNIDTLFWSIFSFIIFLIIFFILKISNSLKPNKIQLLIEIIYKLIEYQCKNVSLKIKNVIIPICFTIFIWILFMNLFDLLPIDFFLLINSIFNFKIYNNRILTTADLNTTLGISFGIYFFIFFINLKKKGLKFIYYLFIKPFNIIFLPFNFFINFMEYFSRIFSLSMRLFGNMYAGELIFLLISLLSNINKLYGFFLQILIELIWSIFHIFIIFLQAFIYTMLTIVYINI